MHSEAAIFTFSLSPPPNDRNKWSLGNFLSKFFSLLFSLPSPSNLLFLKDFPTSCCLWDTTSWLWLLGVGRDQPLWPGGEECGSACLGCTPDVCSIRLASSVPHRACLRTGRANGERGASPPIHILECLRTQQSPKARAEVGDFPQTPKASADQERPKASEESLNSHVEH